MENKVRDGLPPTARLVFKGVIFEVWQWDQEMFDGTTEVFEKVWRHPTVEIIATVGDHIILEEQDQPNRKNNINLPAGRADKGDDPLEEAKRELLEETGYASDNWSLLMHHSVDGKVLHDVYYFVARDCKKVAEQQLDPGEKIEMRLIPFDELFSLIDDPRFWIAPEFITYLLEAKIDPEKKEEFKKLVFGK
jgi:ADP-ribose pyrophosphatase